jgi:3-hydroxyacyl-CoA dehydrogenase
MEVKERVQARRGKSRHHLASNTSYLNIDRIAAFTKRPADVLGLHFFSPANVMKLLEVVRAAETSEQTLASAMKLARTIKKVGVVAGVCDGSSATASFALWRRGPDRHQRRRAAPADRWRAAKVRPGHGAVPHG